MGFAETIYNKMTIGELCCRLPSDLATKTIKNKIKNVEDIKILITECKEDLSKVDEIKNHVNEIINNNGISKLLAVLQEDEYKKIYPLLTKTTEKKLLENKDLLNVTFVFNLCDKNNYDEMEYVLKRVISSKQKNVQMINTILRRSGETESKKLFENNFSTKNKKLFLCGLCSSGLRNFDHKTKVDLLRVLATSKTTPSYINGKLDLCDFAALEPKYRLTALSKYLSFFPDDPKYPVQVFNKDVSETELVTVLFSSTTQNPTKTKAVLEKYKKIVK